MDKLDQAMGITYEADEALSGVENLHERDHQRCELNPESVESKEQNK